MSDPKLRELIHLSNQLLCANGQRLFHHSNSRVIVRVELPPRKGMVERLVWIKRWNGRLKIYATRFRYSTFDSPSPTTPIYNSIGPDYEWSPVAQALLEELRRRFPLEALAHSTEE